MFGDSERDKLQYLSRAGDAALNRCYGNHIEARQLVAKWVSQDRRFDGLDPVKLAQRVDEQRSNGAKLDLTDPRLRGGEPRPLEKDLSW